jgi:hypothetical protein
VGGVAPTPTIFSTKRSRSKPIICSQLSQLTTHTEQNLEIIFCRSSYFTSKIFSRKQHDMYPPSPSSMFMKSERQSLLRPRPTISISKDTSSTTGMVHISPRSVVLKQDAHEPLLFIPAATPVFEEVQIHARLSGLDNNRVGVPRMKPFPEPAEPFWNIAINCDISSNLDYQESTSRREIVPVIELEDDDGCIPEPLLFPVG